MRVHEVGMVTYQRIGIGYRLCIQLLPEARIGPARVQPRVLEAIETDIQLLIMTYGEAWAAYQELPVKAHANSTIVDLKQGAGHEWLSSSGASFQVCRCCTRCRSE